MNNYNFTQSLDGLNNIEADTINTSVLNVNSLIVNTAQITTLSNSNLVNCTSNTPVNNNSIVNKTYVDTNFVDLLNQQIIAGNKIFNDTITVLNDITYQDILATFPIKELQTYLTGNILTYMPLFNLNIYNFITKNSSGVQKDALKITNADMTTNCNFITNNQNTFNNFAPISNTSPSISTHLTTKNYTDTTFQTIANMTNYVDVATNNQIVSGSKIFTNDQSFKVNLKIYDQTVLSTKYMQASQLIDTFLLQSQNGQASQFNISLQNVGGAYNTILSMNSSQATIAGSLSVNSILTSNTSATLKNSNTFGTLTTDEQTINSWLNLKFRTRIYDIFGSGNYTQMYMIGGNEFVIGPNGNSDKISLYCKDGAGVQTLTFSSASIANTSNAPFISNSQATFNTVAPLCSIAPTLSNHLCNKTYVDSVGASSILSSNNTFTGTNTFSNDITLSKSKNNSTYATYNSLTGSYIGYVSESVSATYLSTTTNTVYQCGAITPTQIGFYNVNYEVELNSSGMASTITKIYLFISDNNVSTTIPIDYPGAKANNFSTQTYASGESTYHSGGFTFLHNPANNNIYALQLKIIYATGSIQRKSVIRFTRVI